MANMGLLKRRRQGGETFARESVAPNPRVAPGSSAMKTAGAKEKDTDTTSTLNASRLFTMSGAGEGSYNGADAVISGRIAVGGRQSGAQ
jgi:hypothetical protein